MKAMILAAGLGTRMKPLTDTTPKPLLVVNGKPLLEHHIQRLVSAGFTEIVINVAYLGDQIESFISGRSDWGAQITVCNEGDPLETAGGIVNALPFLGHEPFLVFNGDVWLDCDLSALVQSIDKLSDEEPRVHLVMTSNPEHHPQGDFVLMEEGSVALKPEEGEAATSVNQAFTYSGVGIYHPDLFRGLEAGKRPLGPLLREWIRSGWVSGEFFAGFWLDVGTPERLQHLKDFLVKPS